MSASTHPTVNLQLDTGHRQILRLALPISAAIVVPQINFITNNIFLGQLGQAALAIAGITGVYYLVFAVIGNGLNNGLQALISRRAGENRFKDIAELFQHGIWVAMGFAALGIVLTYTLAPYLLDQAMHDKSGFAIAIDFLKIRIWGLPFLYIYQMRNALLVGINKSKLLIFGTATEAIVNIVLDYALIFGHWGFPEMGFNGAAYASIVAEALGLGAVFLVIRWEGMAHQLGLFTKVAFNGDAIRLILRQSYPLILQFAISIVSWEYFYLLIEHHGTRDLAVSNTMRNLFGFFGCFTWAFAATTNTMVSNVIGQGKPEAVLPLIHRILAWSVGFACVVCVLLNLAPSFLLQVYGQGDDFIAAAIPVLRIVSFAMILMSVSTVWVNAVTGTGNSKMNLYTELTTIVVYIVYVTLVLETYNLPITIGWMSEWLYWAVMFVPSYWYLRSGRWKKLKI